MPIIALAIAIAGAVIQGTFIWTEHKEKYLPAVILKGSAAALFCAIGFIALGSAENGDFAQLILIGLCFGALGDILLNLRFCFRKSARRFSWEALPPS